MTAAPPRAIPSWQITLGVALLALGFLIAAQLASEGPRVRYTTQERTPLLETATSSRRSRTPSRPGSSTCEPRSRRPRRRVRGRPIARQELNAELEQARIAAGLIRLTGTGIVLQLEDSQDPCPGRRRVGLPRRGARHPDVVEELWLGGAEAIAVNGERITPTTAIIDVGSSLLVNSAYLAPPYQVTALGPATCTTGSARRRASSTSSASRVQAYGIRLSFAEPESVDMPAFVGTVTLRYSRPLASPAPGASASPAASPGR